MTDELNTAEMKSRAVKGVASLLARQLFVRIIGFFGMLILARILTPEIFGVFAIAQFAVMFFEQFSSLGLSAALLRKKEQTTPVELRTVFTVQQSIVAGIVICVLFGAPSIARYFLLAEEYTWLMRAMAVGLVLASLKTVPTILLERGLRHDLVAVSEVAEFVTYQTIAILLAVQGFGVWALIAALLARGVGGVVVLHAMSGWRPRIGFDRTAFAQILRFGVPIQLASFAGLATNAVIPVLVGSSMGAAAAGHANFSRSILDAVIFQPLIMMSRVQFRVFGRMQDERDRLSRAVERSLYAGSLLAFPAAALVVSQAQPFVDFVVTSKWSAAIPVLYLLGVAYLLYAVVQPIMQALKALGDAKTPLYGVLLQGTIQAVVFLSCVKFLGLSGYALGLAGGLAAATWLAHHRLRQHLSINVWRSIRSSLAAAVIAGAVAFGINQMTHGIPGMLMSIGSCLLTYVLVMGLLDGRRLGAEVSEIATTLLPKSPIVRFAVAGIGGVLIRLDRIRS